MAEETWGEYSKLVLKELERLNDNSEKMRSDMDERFQDLKQELTEFKNVEGKVDAHSKWLEKVNDVWSPNQMQAAKYEIYAQKNKWTAAVAIITFVQIIMGVAIALISKLFK